MRGGSTSRPRATSSSEPRPVSARQRAPPGVPNVYLRGRTPPARRQPPRPVDLGETLRPDPVEQQGEPTDQKAVTIARTSRGRSGLDPSGGGRRPTLTSATRPHVFAHVRPSRADKADVTERSDAHRDDETHEATPVTLAPLATLALVSLVMAAGQHLANPTRSSRGQRWDEREAPSGVALK
jgi:hypothetical protein